MQFNLVSREGAGNITAFISGNMYAADEQHPFFNEIVRRVLEGDETVASLFDADNQVAEIFTNLTDRIRIDRSRVLIDNDEIDDVYADQIVETLRQGDDEETIRPLVKFLENVYTNLEAHTRKNLSRWLEATGGFTIDEDGDILGYKGLTAAGGSVHLGPAVVNGKDVNGSVPNEPGSVVEMKRSAVEHDPSVACASGLHVGTWSYARSFGQGVTALVKVNPRDVVSVPTDCGGQKMRVSRYKVVRYIDEALQTAVAPSGFVPAEDYPEYDAGFTDGYSEGYEDGYSDAENDL